MTLSFDTETIRLINLFENITGAPVKDCIVDGSTNSIYFVIKEGKVGIAIGKNGSSVKNAENVMGKNIKIFEFSKDLNCFVRNIIPQAVEIKIRSEKERTVIEVKIEKKNKALTIGRDGKNLKLLKELLNRNHKVNDLVVV